MDWRALAGTEGIEPPLELLESSGLPLTYVPSESNYSRLLEDAERFDGRVKRWAKACDEDVQTARGMGEDERVNRRAVFLAGIVVQFGRKTGSGTGGNK